MTRTIQQAIARTIQRPIACTIERVIHVVATAAALGLATAAAAQDWPIRPIRIVVAYQAGQGTDVATRYVAERLTRAFGQSFYVENRGGAGGSIGTAEAARAAPDGYAFTMGTNGTHALNAFLYASGGFDAEKDFDPVILVSTFPMVVLAGASSPLKSVGDFQVPLAVDTISAARPHIESGKLRPLAVTSSKASALLPGVPAIADRDVRGFEVIAWNALYAPRGTPPAIIARLHAEVAKPLEELETRQRLLQLGHERPAGRRRAAASERRKQIVDRDRPVTKGRARAAGRMSVRRSQLGAIALHRVGVRFGQCASLPDAPIPAGTEVPLAREEAPAKRVEQPSPSATEPRAPDA